MAKGKNGNPISSRNMREKEVLCKMHGNPRYPLAFSRDKRRWMV